MTTKIRRRSNLQKRKAYLDAKLRGCSRRQACKVAGISQRTSYNIDARFSKSSDLRDQPRLPPARRYTDWLLDKATALLVRDSNTLHTTSTIIQQLRQQGLLKGRVKAQAFLEAWKRRQRLLGHPMSTTSTRTKPLISSRDAMERLAFAREMLRILKSDVGIKRCVFIDETTLERTPHPKASRYLHGLVHCMCEDADVCSVCWSSLVFRV